VGQPGQQGRGRAPAGVQLPAEGRRLALQPLLLREVPGPGRRERGLPLGRDRTGRRRRLGGGRGGALLGQQQRVEHQQLLLLGGRVVVMVARVLLPPARRHRPGDQHEAEQDGDEAAA
jgi:hypothetical protein